MRRPVARALVLVALAVVSACAGERGGRMDAGAPGMDGGSATLDAAADALEGQDARPGDASPPDASPSDASPLDAGPPPPDAGPGDAGPPDAGPPDSGPPDAGACVPPAPGCGLRDGVCAGSMQPCRDGAWSPCSAGDYGPDYQFVETRCDRLDNDCNGMVDEGCGCVLGATRPCSMDVGACRAGVETCEPFGARFAFGPCSGVLPGTETCNGIDDDCDASTDEELTPPPCALTIGVCAGTRQTCAGAAGWRPCGAAEYGPSYVADEGAAHCDLLDNDCDGSTDEAAACCGPTSCYDLGLDCGTLSRSCGTIDCSGCAPFSSCDPCLPGNTCGGGGTPNVCGCTSPAMSIVREPGAGRSDGSRGGAPWSSPSSITASDFAAATASLGGFTGTALLVADGFGFAIPAGARVTGISARITRWSVRPRIGYTYDVRDDVVQLTLGGMLVGVDRGLGGAWGAIATASFGSTTDTWGRTWTAAEVNDPSFGIAVSAYLDSSGSADASVDYVSLTVTYTTDCTTRCALGTSDCNDDATDGCEVSTRTDVANCGGCRRACATPPGATATCTSGRCGFTCVAPYADCDGFPDNGCETDTSRRVDACGGCGMACPLRPNTTPTCTAAACTYACSPSHYRDCNAAATDGCEVDSRSDPRNCGGCGVVCPGTQACCFGVCRGGGC